MSRIDEQRQLEFRRRARSMLVNVRGSLPSTENPNERVYFTMVGTIVVANDRSCYVVVRRALILDDALYRVILADGSAMDITSSHFSVPHEDGYLSGFHIKHKDLEYDVHQLGAVELGGDVSMFQQVKLCDFHNENLNVTRGQVNNIDGVRFTHSCGPTPFIANGAAVFDEDGHLAGICVDNLQGPTVALTRATLEIELNKIFGSKDFEHFQSLAMVDGW